MRTHELKPTENNIKDTFLKDGISRDIDIMRFCQLICNDFDGCSIALDGKWGSGKTFFVKQTKMVLDAYNDRIQKDIDKKIQDKCAAKDKTFAPDSCLCVYYDSWANDNDDDPILSLVYTIAQSINVDFPSNENTKFLGKAASILKLISGRDWEDFIKAFDNNDPLLELQKAKDLESTISDFLDSILIERGNRLVVFIDELDRCKPSYAVKALERIKHYFSDDRIVFVFALNISELQNTIKRFYGEGFDACRYLDRFFDFQITLPKINLQKYYNLIGFNIAGSFNIICDSVIKTFQMEMREIGRFLNLSESIYETGVKKINYDITGFGVEFCLLYIAPVIIGLKMIDNHQYIDFIEGRDPTPLLKVIAAANLESYVFMEILEKNETLDDDSGKAKVSIEDKFKEIYDIVFSTSYEGRSKKIGNIIFNCNMKEILLQIINTIPQEVPTDS